MTKLKKTIGFADTETLTETGYNIEGQTRIWVIGFKFSDSPKLYHFTDWKDFFDFISQHKVHLIYFHNLKFDGEFIIQWLVKQNLEHTLIDQLITADTKGISYSQIYFLRIKWNNFITEIRCSYLLTKTSIEDLGKMIGNVRKLTIDYDKYRKPNHKPTKEELEYLNNDIEIARLATKFLLDEIEKKDFLTISSFAFSYAYEKLQNSDYDKFMFRSLIPNYRLPNFRVKNANFLLSGFFVNDYEEYLKYDEKYRKSYQGGYTYLNKKYSNKTLTDKLYYYDVNSMYPSIMSDYLPYGYGYDDLHRLQKDLKIQVPITTLLTIKFYNAELKPRCFHVIGRKIVRFGSTHTEWENKVKDKTLTLWDFEWKWVQKNYKHLNYVIIEKRYFPMYNYLSETITQLYNERKSIPKSNPKNYIMKLILNSIYGTLATNPIRYCWVSKSQWENNYKNISGYEISKENNERKVALKLDCYKVINKKPRGETKNVIISSFITSKARCKIYETIDLIGFDNFIYCDTDSILSKIPLLNNIVDETELGKWKLEHISKKFKLWKPKMYKLTTDENVEIIKAKGIKYKDLINYSTELGDIIHGAGFQQKRVEGGIIFTNIDKKLHKVE